MLIIPSINASNLADAKKQAAIVKSFLSRKSWAHLDISDGVFGSIKNWGEPAEFGKLKLGFYKIEVHLMVENPEDVVELWLKAGAKRIAVHLEAVRNSSYILDLCQKYNGELMIAINPETMAENLIPYWRNIKYFQLLAVAPGRSGQKFQESVWDKVHFLRERAPNVKIEIDGGVNPEIARQAAAFGVALAVSGSYIMAAANPADAYRNLTALCTPSTNES